MNRNGGVVSLLDFAKAFELVIASSFQKREEHLLAYRSSVAKTHMDHLLLRKCNRGLCKDCKVILGENLTTQHKLVMSYISRGRKRNGQHMTSQGFNKEA